LTVIASTYVGSKVQLEPSRIVRPPLATYSHAASPRFLTGRSLSDQKPNRRYVIERYQLSTTMLFLWRRRCRPPRPWAPTDRKVGPICRPFALGSHPHVCSPMPCLPKDLWISEGWRKYGGALWETVHTVHLYEKCHGATRLCLMNSPCPSNDAHTFPQNETSATAARNPYQTGRRIISDLSVIPHSRQQWIPTPMAAETARGSNRRAGRTPRISRAELSGRSCTWSGVLRSEISERDRVKLPRPVTGVRT